jgi:hypothetical protein
VAQASLSDVTEGKRDTMRCSDNHEEIIQGRSSAYRFEKDSTLYGAISIIGAVRWTEQTYLEKEISEIIRLR